MMHLLSSRPPYVPGISGALMTLRDEFVIVLHGVGSIEGL